jgi:hypothetical protein
MGDRRDAMESAERASIMALSTRPGSGHRCDACLQPIESSQVECMALDRTRDSSESFRFHQWCYYAKYASNR